MTVLIRPGRNGPPKNAKLEPANSQMQRGQSDAIVSRKRGAESGRQPLFRR
jgi:hypothetical protein